MTVEYEISYCYPAQRTAKDHHSLCVTVAEQAHRYCLMRLEWYEKIMD